MGKATKSEKSDKGEKPKKSKKRRKPAGPATVLKPVIIGSLLLSAAGAILPKVL